MSNDLASVAVSQIKRQRAPLELQIARCDCHGVALQKRCLFNSNLDPAVDGLPHTVRCLPKQLRFTLPTELHSFRIYSVAGKFAAALAIASDSVPLFCSDIEVST